MGKQVRIGIFLLVRLIGKYSLIPSNIHELPTDFVERQSYHYCTALHK